MIKKFIFILAILLLTNCKVFAYDNTNYPRFIIFQGQAVNMNNIVAMGKHRNGDKYCLRLMTSGYNNNLIYCYTNQEARDNDFNKALKYNVIR
jgi:hypothetical protein